ncbi:PqiC family protein [Cellvibrio mixtus]|uniref:PqiC family protein n=1 Tax=Cellvibrio mixtus TaxID=39650 RepID=UPI000586F4F3|nr:PqiC family protein [Cellvibrio mixtus]
MGHKILLVVITLAICACQNSPRREYFALSASEADFNITAQTPVNQFVGIGPVIIPEYLQQNKIGYWKTPQQLILLDNHYWAEPLERGITRVLALELQAAHTDWRVLQFPWPNNQRPNYSIKIDIQRLDAFTDHLVFEANIDWINVQTRAVLGSQRIKLRQDSRANSAAIARAISELLQQAARIITPPPLHNGS